MTMRGPAQLGGSVQVATPGDIPRVLAELSRVLQECGVSDVGGVRGSNSYDGSQWSGVNVVRGPLNSSGNRNGYPQQILRCTRMGTNPLGGMASVHVQVTDDEGIEIGGDAPNTRVVMDLKWQSGRGGGEAQVDITRGSVFTIGAADTITAHARIIPAVDTTFYPGPFHKRVEATVCWGGGINPKAALGTSEGITALAAVATARVAIPSQAEGVMAVTDDPANYGTLLVNFYRAAAGGRAFGAFNPYGNVTPVVSGAEFVDFTATLNCQIIPIWVLHL